MADEQDDGIIQKIKLALDLASVEKLSHDATAAGITVATQIQAQLAKSGLNEKTANAVMTLISETRERFERGMTGLHTKLLNNIIDIPEAEKKANELAIAVNKKLVEGLKKAKVDAKPFVMSKIIETASIRPADFRVASVVRQQAAERQAVHDGLVDVDNSAEAMAIMQEKVTKVDLAAAAEEKKARSALKLNVINKLNTLDVLRNMRNLTTEEQQLYIELSKEEERLGMNAAKRQLAARAQRQKANDVFTALNMPGEFTSGKINESRSQRAARLALDLKARNDERVAAELRVAQQLREANDRAADKTKITPVMSAEPGDFASMKLMAERAQIDKRNEERRIDEHKKKQAEARRVTAKKELELEIYHRERERRRNELLEQEDRAEHEKNHLEAQMAKRDLGDDWRGRKDMSHSEIRRRERAHEMLNGDRPDQWGDAAWRAQNPQVGPAAGQNLIRSLPTNAVTKQIPAAWRAAFEQATATVRKEMAGEVTLVEDAGEKMKASIKKWFLIEDGAVDKFKAQSKRAFSFFKIPEAQKLESVRYGILQKKSSDPIDLQRRVNLEQMQNQLMGSKPTMMGKVVAALGVDIRKTSPEMVNLTDKMKELGATSGRIGQLLPKMGGQLRGVSGGAMQLAKSFGLLYTAHRIVGFLKETIEESNANEVSFTRLSTTLADFGVKMSDAKKLYQPVFDSQAAMGMTYQHSAETLARLTQITGDYQKGLKALPIIQDIVASGYMTMEQATRAVGRGILGDIGNLSRYGIVIDKNKDLLDQLGKRFSGELLAKSKTFTGQLSVMATQWSLVKIAIGDVLKQSDEGTGLFSTLIGLFKEMKEWINQNAVGIKLLGTIILASFAAVGLVIMAFVASLVYALNIIGTVGVALRQTFISLPDLAVQAWATAMETIVITLKVFAKTIDAIFNEMAKEVGSKMRSNLGGAFDETIARAEKIRKAAADRAQKNQDEGGEMIRDIWKNPYASPGVADQKPGPGMHIRKEHPARAKAINQARINTMSDNPERMEMGLKALDKIEAVIRDRMEEAHKEQNTDELELLNTELQNIEKVRKARAKKNDQSLKEQAAFTKELGRLAEVAKNRTDDKAALEAVTKLQAMHQKLLETRSNMKTRSEAWLVVEANISRVEDAIRGRIELQDTLYEKRLKRLHQQVELGVDEETAIGRLTEMYNAAEEAAKKAEAAAGDASRTEGQRTEAVDEAIRQRLRMSQLESAMSSRSGRRNEQVDALEKDMEDPDKREAAERKLKSIQTRAERDAASARTDHAKKEAKELAERVKKIIEGSGAELKEVGKQISAAEELIKHDSTRLEGVELLRKTESDILELLKKQNLTILERHELEGQLGKVRKDLKKAGEPELNMMKSLAQTLEQQGHDMAVTLAGDITSVMDTAFQGIFRDSRNLGQALRSIPRGFAKAMLDELAKMAKGKATENLAWAIEETAKGIGMAAHGNFPGAGAAFTSAAQHTAAAAAWGLLGSAAGAAGQSASNAYSNSTDFASGNRGANQNNVARGPDIYLNIDGIDPSNPRHQQLVGDTQRQYTERYGGRIVTSSGR